MVIDLNFIISLILLLITFCQYSKLSHMPTNLLLDACFEMNAIVNIMILLNFLIKILYEIEIPR